jgi:hypothetical protein
LKHFLKKNQFFFAGSKKRPNFAEQDKPAKKPIGPII